MQDAQLIIASNLRPAITPGAAVSKYLFPDLFTPTFIDLRAIMDLGRGARPVYANFRVAAAFNAQANNWLRPAIFVDSTPTFANVLTNGELTIAAGPQIVSAGLNVVGSGLSVVLPPLNDIVLLAGARRYITLGFECYVPSTDWTTGGLDAWFDTDPYPGRPITYAAGG